MPRNDTRVSYQCSFCGKSQDQVQRLIAGPGSVYICDECVALCREIIQEEFFQAAAQADPAFQQWYNSLAAQAVERAAP